MRFLSRIVLQLGLLLLRGRLELLVKLGPAALRVFINGALYILNNMALLLPAHRLLILLHGLMLLNVHLDLLLVGCLGTAAGLLRRVILRRLLLLLHDVVLVLLLRHVVHVFCRLAAVAFGFFFLLLVGAAIG